MALACAVKHVGSGRSGECDGKPVSRVQSPGPLVVTLRRVDGEDSGRCSGEQLAVELMDLAAFVYEREADRSLAGEGQVIGYKTIVLNGDVHRLDIPIAANREAGDEQDKRCDRTGENASGQRSCSLGANHGIGSTRFVFSSQAGDADVGCRCRRLSGRMGCGAGRA